MPLRTHPVAPLLVLITTVCLHAPRPVQAQVLETETARLIPPHHFELGGAFELQTSGGGTERALPFAIGYGLSSRVELLVEPVPYTSIRPVLGPRATGPGDIEATVTYLARRESGKAPAIALAGEVKIPTARNALIGTGRADYAGYFIVSKGWGRFDTHFNLVYTVVGKPAGSALSNIWGLAVAAELRLSPSWQAFTEILATTAAAKGADQVAGGAPVPEAPSGEVVGTVGADRRINSRVHVLFSVSYDNNSTVLFRPGVVAYLP